MKKSTNESLRLLSNVLKSKKKYYRYFGGKNHRLTLENPVASSYGLLFFVISSANKFIVIYSMALQPAKMTDIY